MENEKFAPPNDGEPEVEENLEGEVGVDVVRPDSTTVLPDPPTGISPPPLLVLQEQPELSDVEPTSSGSLFSKSLAIPVWALVVGVVALLALAGLGGGLGGAAIADQTAEVETLTARAQKAEGALSETEDALQEIRRENVGLSAEVAAIDRREEGLERTSEELAAREVELAELEAQIAQREAAVATAEEVAAKNEFGNGVHLVGVDIEPGTYRNSGGNLCYWARLSGTSGDFNELITNGIPDGPTVVTIASSDVAFESSGCGTWKRTQ